MRIVIACFALAATTTASADPAATMKRLTDAGVFDSTACSDDDPGKTFTETSPKGPTTLIVKTLAPTAAHAKALGLQTRDYGTYAITIDAKGAVWAILLPTFMGCSSNAVAFAWSSDGARVELATDTGHGDRVAVLDIHGHTALAFAFAGTHELSPDVRHLAWMSWTAGFPFDPPQHDIDGDLLQIDDAKIWGSENSGSHISEIGWTSATELTFCGSTGDKPSRRFHAVLRRGRFVVAAMTGRGVEACE
jgi:hypothetical protein